MNGSFNSNVQCSSEHRGGQLCISVRNETLERYQANISLSVLCWC